CLGLSVAFKALGIWLLPLCLWRLWKRDDQSRSDVYLFVAVFLVAALAWFAPYAAQLKEMVQTRVASDVKLPAHASPVTWTFPVDYVLTVDHYDEAVRRATYARITTGFAFIGLTFAAVIRRRMSIEVATAAALVASVSIDLVAGSLDRMNIGFA